MNCKGCGTELPAQRQGPTRIWCSDRCRKQTLYSGRCEDCGKPTNGYNGKGTAAKLCRPCRDERVYGERNRRLVKLWEQGVSATEIGAELGMAQSAVCSWVDFHRDKGEQIGRRHLTRDSDEVQARRELIARLIGEGWTNAEIAERVGTSTESAAYMVYVMRRQGWDLPQRSSGNRRKVGTA